MRRLHCLALVSVVGCQRPLPATTTPTTAAPVVGPLAATPVSDDLGPADFTEPVSDDDDDDDDKGPEFAFGDDGPERIFGTRGDGRRRPNAPGRAGALHVAIDTPYQLYGRASTYVHVAAWRADGKPAANARVFVGRGAVGRTDKDGTLVFRYRKPTPKLDKDGEPLEDDHSFDTNAVFVIDGRRCGAVDFSPYQRTPTFASDELYVYTDRGVYRPGETVRVRVIGWRLESDYAPIQGGDVELFLRDGGGHSIAAATIHTDEFGAGTADMRVPVTADAGDYELSIAYQNARESTGLQIRRFEAPQIRIEHTLPRHLTKDRKSLAFTVTARPSAGGSLGKGRIEVEARGGDGHTVKLARDVDGNGPHAFELADKQLAAVRAKGGPISVVVRASDARGREDTTIRTIDLSNNPYVAVLEPDKDAYATGDPVVVVARISDIDDVAVRNRDVELRLGERTKLREKTDARGIATFRFAMPRGDQALALHLDDVEAAIATSAIGWTAPTAMTTTLSEPVVREHAKVQIVARFPRGHVPVDRRVHVDITDTSGAIVGATILRATQEKGAWVARGEIVAPTWGSALFTFFALGDGMLDERELPTQPGDPMPGGGLGLLLAGQQIAVVPDRELEIELAGVPERASPGAALDVQATVRDRQGKLVEFAGSAAVVDSAVLALHDPLEVTPMDRFYDPDLRTLGTTGAQMLTWPVVSRNWGNHRGDVALPPFPFLGGGKPDTCESHWDEQDHRAFAAANGSGGLGLMGIGSGGGGSGSGTIGLGSVGTIGHGAGGPAVPTITVRKNFGDTSLWVPNLRGRGKATVTGILPDTIGEQEIVVVASDRNGGVGVARERIVVDQDMFVEADLPDVAIVGERLQIPVLVHNRTKQASELRVALQGAHAQVQVGANDVATTLLPLRSDAPGAQPIVVQASGDKRVDRIERDVFVAPAGVPIATVRSEIATKGKPIAFELEGRAGATAHLRVDVPAVTAAFVGLDALLETVADDPWSLAGDLAAASVLLQLAERHGLRSNRLAELRGQAVAALAMTGRVQRPNGAFGYWRNGRSSAYVTAMVLDGLLEARAAKLRVPAKTITRAAAFLAMQLPKGELADVRDIGWWEGDDAAVKRALESEIFAVLARLPAAERTGDVGKTVDAMAKHAEATLAESNDIRALANATIGLVRLGKIDRERAAALAKRLVAARNEGHWEPTWFAAWGGNIEATTVALEALAIASPTEHAAEKRDALRWLLATRESWGTWHNERGSLAALRAIAAVGAPKIEGKTTIRVTMDGETLARVKIDPADPLASATALAHLDLPAAAIAGKHRITVESDGPLAPSVTLVQQQWKTGTGARVERSGLVLAATGLAKLTAGDPAELVITAKGKRLGGATLRIGKSGLVDVDLAALADRLGRGGSIAAIRPLGDALELRLAPGVRDLDLRVPVLARRRGAGHWPAVALLPVTKATAVPLIVDPGALAIE